MSWIKQFTKNNIKYLSNGEVQAPAQEAHEVAGAQAPAQEAHEVAGAQAELIEEDGEPDQELIDLLANVGNRRRREQNDR